MSSAINRAHDMIVDGGCVCYNGHYYRCLERKRVNLMRWIYERRRILAIVLLAAVAAFGSRLLSGMSVEDIINYTPASPILAAIILLAAYCIKSIVVVIPISLLYICAGILFPTNWAFFVTFSGVFLESSIGYWMGKNMGREKVSDLIRKNKKVETFFSVQQNNAITCLLARISPLPFDLVSPFFGASGMKFPVYVVFTLLGICPVMVPTVLAGTAILNPLSMEFLLPFGISLSISMIILVIYSAVMKKRVK